MSTKKRIESIHDLIIEIASGNFDAQGNLSEQQDDFDAIIAGINMLGEELKASTVTRDYLNSIYRGIVDMVFILDHQFKILSCNAIACEVLQYHQEELNGAHFKDILCGASKKLRGIERKLEDKGSFHSIEKTLRTRDGRKIEVSCSGSLLYSRQDATISNGILCIARDVTAVKEAKQQLVNKNKEMDQFVYKASHDIKGPLASIIGLTNVAEMEITDPKALHYFNMIRNTSIKLNNTLVTLLKLAVNDKSRKEKKCINLCELLSEIIMSLNHADGFDKVRFFIDVPSDLSLMTNDVLLTTIIQNLIQNAIKFRKDTDPYVKIKANVEKGGIYMVIRDNGLGIKKSAQSKVFDMFYRGSEKSEGTGLGLYIVKSHLQKIGGHIRLKSKEGKGTIFSLMIPSL